MILRPYKTRAPRHAVGLVISPTRALMEGGEIKRIRDLPSNAWPNGEPGLRLFGDLHTIVESYAFRGRGDLDMFHRKWVTWWPDPDHKVVLLKDDPGSGPDVLEGLVAWRDFLARQGASIGSTGASTRSLLRTTLSEPLATGVGPSGPKAITQENMGGRQWSFRPASYYPSFVHLDLRAAYARTLGELFFDPAGEWVENTRKVIPDTPTPVIVRAKIRYPPDLDLAPLPQRRRRESDDYDYPREWPIEGEMTGTYEARELALAQDAGCDVKIERVWVRSYMVERENYHPFARWWELIQRARKLPDYAGDLAKMAGAALWGVFLGSDDLWRVHYEEGEETRARKIRARWHERMFVGYDLAEIVTALVRVRLHRELIIPAFTADRLISVNTDGGLLIDKSPMPRIKRDWRPKYTGSLQYIAPLAYRFKQPGSTKWDYVLAGVPEHGQGVAFEEKWRAVRGRTAQGHFGMLEITDETAERRLREAFA